MLDGGAYAVAKEMQEQSAELRYQKLREAVRRLYYSAHWFADRDVDKAQLWTDVRDAAEFTPGGSPKALRCPVKWVNSLPNGDCSPKFIRTS